LRIQAGVFQLLAGERSLAPIGALVAFIQLNAKLLFKNRAKPDSILAQDARRHHGVKYVGKLKTKIPSQTQQIIFCSVKDLFDFWVGEKGR